MPAYVHADVCVCMRVSNELLRVSVRAQRMMPIYRETRLDPRPEISALAFFVYLIY